ncbi:MAG: hypothetical protein VKL39_00440 [Leptolyngbyaceae bacterium]|nr:hypothetical protein [Leptolyngbyaceae bacterium]
MNTDNNKPFREIVVADLTHFVLVLPTDTVARPHSQNHLGIPIPKRVYGHQGLAFIGHDNIGTVQGIRLQSVMPEGSPFKVSPRLSQGIPLSFEMSCQCKLPQAIAHQALFLYSFEHDPTLHYGVFKNVIPQCVRIYPFTSMRKIYQQVRQFSRVKTRLS